MAIERWGSLSVADHTDTNAMTANVLLYDRLIMPTLAPDAEEGDRQEWIARRWDPDLQERRIEQLGVLAIRRPWNAERQRRYQTRLEELKAEEFDADNIAYQTTRMILAQETVVETFEGVTHVEVIAAYNSTESASRDFSLEVAPPGVGGQALLLTRRLVVPAYDDPEDSLKAAVELAMESDFRQKRADLFEWQALMAGRGIPADAAVSELAHLVDTYNLAVRRASNKVLVKYAFTVVGIALGFVSGLTTAAAASAGVALLKFACFDRTPGIEPANAKPAAMFHDIEARIGATLLSAG